MKAHKRFEEGNNLFYVVEDFSTNSKSLLCFDDVRAGIQNIFILVTGSSVSEIDVSEIDCDSNETSSTATIFLLNPNGITFKSNGFNNKTSNFAGSFIASTASSVVFEDGTQFSAAATDITTSVPVGLQFGEQTGEIQVLGAGLAVPAGRTLALVGGDIAIAGGDLTTAEATTAARNLKAPEGRIELGSVAASSLVSLNSIEQGWELGYEKVKHFQNIKLANFALVDTSGESGGDVKLQGNQIRLSDGAQIGVATRGAGTGGNLVVNAAESLELTGNFQGRFYSGLFAVTDGSGNAGSLEINTQRLVVQDGATITASTRGRGDAGHLTIRASTVDLSGTGTSANETVVPSGLFAQVLSGATGKGGNLTIATEQLQVQGGARAATSTFGTGNAGNLTVRASKIINLSGKSADGSLTSGLFVESHEKAEGDRGILTIAGQLSIESGAEISSFLEVS